MKPHATFFKLFVTLLLTTISITLEAQAPKAPNQGITPNAMSFLRYGEIPVSLYTGTPDISIPIDTVHSGKLELPISLSYHSGGVKVDEHPGWVGLGWNLQVGGCITRIQKGGIDEFQSSKHKKGYAYTYAAYNNYPLESFWDSIYARYNSLADTGEPDKFCFNFEGYSGFFILDSLGKWQVSCNRPIKVKDNGTMILQKICEKEVRAYANCKNILYKSFTITNEEGVEYTFGEDAIDYSTDLYNQQDLWFSNTWHLIKIQHPNGDCFDFHYKRKDYQATLSYQYIFESATLLGDGYLSNSPNPYGGQLTSPVYLESITGNNLKIDFQSSPSTELSYTKEDYMKSLQYIVNEQANWDLYYLRDENSVENAEDLFTKKIKWHQLNTILIKYNTENRLKKIDFKYSNNPRVRLTLNELKISGQLDYTEQIYKFKYSDMEKLPPYTSQQKDAWGFYNGTEYQGGEDRVVNPDVLAYGSLSEITYPTGGKTIFKFEPHQYICQLGKMGFDDLVYSQSSKIAGGLRIKSIINVSNDGKQTNKKDFFYVTGYSNEKVRKNKQLKSSGILEGRVCYYSGPDRCVAGDIIYDYSEVGKFILKVFEYTVFYIPIQVHRLIYGKDGPGISYYSIGSSENLLPNTNALGQHIVYDEVVEKSLDGSYVISNYTSLFDSQYRNRPPSHFFGGDINMPYSAMEQYRGYLKKQVMYNNNDKCIKQTEISYEPLNNKEKSVRAIYFNRRHFQSEPLSSSESGIGLSIFSGCVYRVYTHKLVEKSRTTWQYDGATSTPLITQHYYTYNDIGQQRSDSLVYMKYGNLQKEVSNYHYAWESNEDFKEKCFFSLIDNIVKMRNGSPYNIIRNDYSLYNNKFPYLSQVYISNGRGNFHNEYSCYSVDETGNPVCVKRKGIPYIYLWGADYSCPVAEITNADFLSVENLLGFPLTAAPNHAYHIQKKIEELRQNLPSAAITSYTYIPHVGVTSITDPAGKKTYYGYDTFGLLNSVSDQHWNPLKSYTHSTYLAGKENEGLDLDSLITGDRFNRLHILGPQEVSLDSSYHYMVDWTDMPYHYKWRVPDTDTSFVSLIPNEDEVVLKMHGGQARTTRLIVDVFSGDGKKICNQYKVISPCQPKLDMWLEDWGNGPMIHVRSKDGSNLRFCHLYLNDQELYRYPINANLDKPNFYLLLNLSRNRYRDIYQITAMTGIGIETKSFTTSELFPND